MAKTLVSKSKDAGSIPASPANTGPSVQPGVDARLSSGRSPVQIRYGPPRGARARWDRGRLQPGYDPVRFRGAPSMRT